MDELTEAQQEALARLEDNILEAMRTFTQETGLEVYQIIPYVSIEEDNQIDEYGVQIDVREYVPEDHPNEWDILKELQGIR